MLDTALSPRLVVEVRRFQGCAARAHFHTVIDAALDSHFIVHVFGVRGASLGYPSKGDKQ